jgi:hypothetical protein
VVMQSRAEKTNVPVLADAFVVRQVLAEKLAWHEGGELYRKRSV